MRGTSCSSRTLLNVTHTAPVRQAHQQNHRRYFLWWSRKSDSISKSISPYYHITLFVVLLLLNIGFCNARRLEDKTRTAGMGYSNDLEYSADRDGNGNYNSDEHNSDVVGREDLDLSKFAITDTEVKTIRFADPNENSNRQSYKRQQKKKHLKSDDMVRVNLNGEYPVRANDVGDYYYGKAETLENNDVQKIGMSTQSLKSIAEQVADSIFAEADSLYDALQTGSSRLGDVSPGDSTSAILQLLAKVDSGNYVMCQ